MTRLRDIALLAGGAVIAVLALKAFEATPAQAQAAGVPTVSASADGMRAWVGLAGGQVAVCEYNTGGYGNYITCVTS